MERFAFKAFTVQKLAWAFQGLAEARQGLAKASQGLSWVESRGLQGGDPLG